MKEIIIPLIYSDIDEVIHKKNRDFVIKFKNGDKITFKKSEYSRKLRRHFIRNFTSEHLD